jgi:hypothetical protein
MAFVTFSGIAFLLGLCGGTVYVAGTFHILLVYLMFRNGFFVDWATRMEIRSETMYSDSFLKKELLDRLAENIHVSFHGYMCVLVASVVAPSMIVALFG